MQREVPVTGYLRKKRKSEAAAIEDALHAGLVTAKQLKKKRQGLQSGNKKDLGLREDGGAFRNGMLRVKAPQSKKPTKHADGRLHKPASKRRRPQQHASI